MTQQRQNQERDFRLLQEWEGVVLSKDEDEFASALHDTTNRENPTEEVVLSVEDVSPDDQALIVPGAVFYLSIGYETNSFGQRKRVSTIRFRRLPTWSTRDFQKLESAAADAQDLCG